MKAFSRDAMGRKSMSEKRKRQFDPRVTSFYQQLQQSKGSFLFHFLMSFSSRVFNCYMVKLLSSFILFLSY